MPRDCVVSHDDGRGAVDRAAATAFGGWIPCDADADRTLLVDNYDSYTYNLYHLIAAVDGARRVAAADDRARCVVVDVPIELVAVAAVRRGRCPGTRCERG